MKPGHRRWLAGGMFAVIAFSMLMLASQCAVVDAHAASTSTASPAPSPSSTPTASPQPSPGDQQCDVPPVLSTFCRIGQGIDGAPGQAAGAAASSIGTSMVQAVTTWVADGAGWSLDQVAGALDESTSPDTDADWFRRDYATMAQLGALCIAIFLFAATVQGLFHRDPAAIARAYLLQAPAAIVGTLVAGALVDRALALTDALSSAITTSTHGDIATFTGHVVEALSIATAGNAGAPLFVVFLGAAGIAITAVILWLELIIRQAAVDICVLFLPLTLSAAVWPETAQWTRHLLHTLAAVILSKFVIVAVLALSVSALAAGASGGGVKAILVGVVLLALAAYCPWAVLRLLPAMSSAAAANLTGLGRRGVAWVTPVSYRPGALAENLVRGRGAGSGTSGISSSRAPAGGGAAAAAAMLATRTVGAVGSRVQASVSTWTTASGRSSSATSADHSSSLTSAARPSPDTRPRPTADGGPGEGGLS